MRAITDIPANTPRPIGRTDSFFPGSVKAAWEEALAAAAEAEDAAAEDDAESAAGVVVVDPEVEELLEVLVEALDVVLAEEDVEEGAAVDEGIGTLDAPLTFTAGLTLADPLALEADPLALEVDPLALEADVLDESVEEELAADEDAEAVDEVEVVIVDPVPSEEPPPKAPLALVPPPELPSANVKLHFFTSTTSGCPCTVMGVNVILHLSMDGPSGVFTFVTVVTVVG